MQSIPEAIRKLLLATDSGGQLDQRDLFTPQSDLAVSSGLAEDIKYVESYTWIRLTSVGIEMKAKVQQ